MPSTYSNLKIQLMATGENATTWGDVTNTNLGTALEEAIAGSADVTFASGDVTLTLTDTNGTQSARNMRLNLTGTTGGVTRNLIVPAIEKVYIVNNTCADAVLVKTAAGSGVTVPAGKTMWVFVNGVSVVDVVTHVTSLTLGSALPVASGGTGSTSGNASALTGFNASNVSSGVLAVSFGGTGASTNTAARVNLLPSYTGNAGRLLALNSGATDVEWVSAGGAGTVTSVNATTAISGLSFSGGPITSAGTLTLSGTLGVQGGGTGTTSFTSGAVLIGNGTSAVSTVSPGTAGNVLVSNGSAWVSQAGGGAVSSVSGSGSGISVSPTTGAVVIQNTGVTSLTNGGGLSLSGSTGGITITNAGVTSITAGSGISVSGSTGSVTISATGGGGSGTFSANDGSVSAPSIFFTGATNMGMYRSGTSINFAAGGVNVFAATSTQVQLSAGGAQRILCNTTSVFLSGTVIFSTSSTPASASATGTAGTITWDSNYIYVCVATNTWKRVAISTW